MNCIKKKPLTGLLFLRSFFSYADLQGKNTQIRGRPIRTEVVQSAVADLSAAVDEAILTLRKAPKEPYKIGIKKLGRILDTCFFLTQIFKEKIRRS